jgi:hypothetical protein
MIYRKKALIKVLKVLENGDREVCNLSNKEDVWVIPKDVFEKTYEEI